MAERPPLAGPPRRRGAGHQRRRRGHPRPRRCCRRCARPAPTSRVCGAPATEELFGFTATGADFTPGRHLRRAGAGGRRPGRAAAAPGPAGADLVHAHGLRAGLVAAAARRLAGARADRSSSPCTTPSRRAAAGQRAAMQALERPTIRGADLVLAVSSDLAANARRLGARDVRVAPALAPPLPPAAARPATRSGPSWASTTAGRWWSRSGRLHPQKGYDVLLDAVGAGGPTHGCGPPPLVAIAGDGPLHERARRPDRAPSGCRSLLLGRRTDVADLLGAADVVRAALALGGQPASPPRRRCAPARRWSPRAPAGIPELVGDGRRPGAGGRRAGAGRRAVTGCSPTPRTRPRWARPGRRQAAQLAGRGGRRAPASSPSTGSCSGPPEAGSP